MCRLLILTVMGLDATVIAGMRSVPAASIRFLTATCQLSEWQRGFSGCLKLDPGCHRDGGKSGWRTGVDDSLHHPWPGLAKAIAGAFSAICRYLPRKVVPET
jgi:hypothetical protein